MQTPFITISLGLETSNLGRMITEAYLKIHTKGLGKEGATAVFPKVIFFLQDGINMKPEDPNYDLKKAAMKCCISRIYPDFISVPLNKKVTGTTTEPVTSMGCRSFLSQYEDVNTGNEQYNGRFNLGVVSLNLPMYALEAKQQLNIMRRLWTKEDYINKFYELLDKYCWQAYLAQMVRVKKLKKTKAKQNPIMFVEGALARLDPEETIEKLFYNNYASISLGYIGIAETSQILKGNIDKEFCLSILEFLKRKCVDFTKESGISFSAYGTPSESYCYKAAKSIKKKFGENVLEHDYLTNSFHFPVWEEATPFEKWDYEEGFAEISSGGNIGYVETPNLKNNLLALEKLIDYGYEHIPYFGINQPVDKCYQCNFEGEFKATSKGFSCPSCGNTDEGTISVIRRVSGYLSAPNSRPFNKGKMQEVIQRVKHST